ncbi:lysozyme [Aeromonas phage AS-yj]|uniref:Lysozyme n=3 Tax=Ceceduovirus TaxID=2842588 RepID=A0A223LE97_9CAUD|nr:lysozyme [Aeromonas phage AS-zj]YP_009834859.1 lysozyme [Aeromonas phage AS-sw]ATI17727.1 lysozyme [Aeromonas phage AS-yj]QAX99137.1 lysozyme [Aeromonas phage Assk]QMV29040.1 lysozyme [Aeromonas phage AP1]UKM62846.1 putative lysozyme [Aeromonas phage P19]ASU00226.1 lysozyme [Aeromonas phage AS-zj]
MLEKMLKFDEGSKLTVYWDTEGYPTIGIGHLIKKLRTKDMGEINRELSSHVGRVITDGKITQSEESQLFAKDLEVVRNSMKGYVDLWSTYVGLDEVRKTALENMVFQMGAKGVNGFPSMLRAMRSKNWVEAKKHGLASAWARQTPNRAKRVTDVIETGTYKGYPFA